MDKWQSAYMDIASRISELSSAKRLKVGAIAVKENRIISMGYNGTPSGWSNDCEDEIITEYETYTDSVLVTKKEVLHAEQNLIAKLAGSNESGRGAEMYVTHSPCLECAKQIYSAGISKVYFKQEYRSTDGIEFLKKCKVEVEQL